VLRLVRAGQGQAGAHGCPVGDELGIAQFP
jgi:hypothetical protein